VRETSSYAGCRSATPAASKPREERAHADEQRAVAHREEAKHRAAAAKYRNQADRATSLSSKSSYLNGAEREERAANVQVGKAADAGKRVAGYSSKEATRQKELAQAIEAEVRAAARLREREAVNTKRALDEARRADRTWTHALVEQTFTRGEPPKPEILRILYLTATPDGGLRVDEEMRRVKAAVPAACGGRGRDTGRTEARPTDDDTTDAAVIR
jgi:hypothetical protein